MSIQRCRVRLGYDDFDIINDPAWSQGAPALLTAVQLASNALVEASNAGKPFQQCECWFAATAEHLVARKVHFRFGDRSKPDPPLCGTDWCQAWDADFPATGRTKDVTLTVNLEGTLEEFRNQMRQALWGIGLLWEPETKKYWLAWISDNHGKPHRM